ncbi:MAG TPA: TPM domain-containing protein [Steroidobacteraceae bacterium]|nr:TPM domain-containing protein [Steroidobacteraceae bacterium]
MVIFLQRLWRHWLASLHPARTQLPAGALAQIEAEIRAAEQAHEGEIRVVIETSLSLSQLHMGLSARQRALQLFASLGVWDTEHNNGVLIYILLADRSVEIIADRAIAQRIAEAQWASLCAEIAAHCGRGELAAACCMAVRSVGQRLARLYPARGGGGNELPNQPILL